MSDPYPKNNQKWFILALAALTNTFVVAAPAMCLPVLFDEISKDIGLSLVQIGVIWGLSSLPAIFMSLVSGVIGDRFKPKWVILITSVLIGLTGALRGLSNDYFSLMLTVLLVGLLAPLITTNVLKTCSLWFPPNQLGMASGLVSMGMALGFMIGSFISASILSPWLGGWRHVVFFYGVISFLVGIPWIFVNPNPPNLIDAASVPTAAPLLKSLSQVIQIRRIWFTGLIGLCVSGCVQGLLGYLPIFLRSTGWEPTTADWAQTSFHLVSMLCVVPITLWSDRIRKREWILMAAAAMTAVGVGLLSITSGALVWAAILMAGMVRDGFMGAHLTSVFEIKGVNPSNSGAAMGFVLAIVYTGNLIAPPIGNSLATNSMPGLPFIFWSALALAGLVGLFYLVRVPQLQPETIQE